MEKFTFKLIRSRTLFLLNLLAVGLFACSTGTRVNSAVSDEHEMSSQQNQPPLAVALSSSEIQDGSLLVMSAKVSDALPRSATGADFYVQGIFQAKILNPGTGEYKDREVKFRFIPIRSNEYEGLLPIPYGMPAGKTKITVRVYGSKPIAESSDDLAHEDVEFKIMAGDYPSETLKVKPKLVTPSPKDLVRIRKELKWINEVYGLVTEKKYWRGPFRLPIKSAVTSPYGSRRVYNGLLQNYHGGLDLKARTGTTIRAPAEGKVVLAKNLYYTGNTVFLDHGYGLITFYGHMSKIQVKKNQFVKRGAVLGKSGKTGRVTGPHLHWQSVLYGIKFNPLGLTQQFEEACSNEPGKPNACPHVKSNSH